MTLVLIVAAFVAWRFRRPAAIAALVFVALVIVQVSRREPRRVNGAILRRLHG